MAPRPHAQSGQNKALDAQNHSPGHHSPPADAPGSQTLLCPWPGANDDENVEAPPPQQAKGQLTAEERIAYQELQLVEHLGSGEFGQVFRGFYGSREVAVKQLYWDNSMLPEVIIQDLTREISPSGTYGTSASYVSSALALRYRISVSLPSICLVVHCTTSCT